jgi:hypothetical protein
MAQTRRKTVIPRGNVRRKPAEVRGGGAARVPQNHRTVDRVTRILEEVVYNPGLTFAELARALSAPRSSVHGFMRGLLAKGWLYEVQRRFYLGPAVYGLTLASGHIRAGLVNHGDLAELHQETGLAVFLGVKAGDHLIYISEAGSDAMAGFEARSNIRRTLLTTAGGKALLAARPDAERGLPAPPRCGGGGTGQPFPRRVRRDPAYAGRDERSSFRHAIRDRDDGKQPIGRGGSGDHASWVYAQRATTVEGAAPIAVAPG